MDKRGRAHSSKWSRSRSDQADSCRSSSSASNEGNWRSSSSASNEGNWRRSSSSQASHTSTWRRSSPSSSSSSEDTSWRQRKPSGDGDVYGHTRRQDEVKSMSRASDMKRGKIVTLHISEGLVALPLSEGYGFLAPILRDCSQRNDSKNVYFRFGENSKTETGLFKLQIGDVLEYISNDSTDNPRAFYACLVECSQRRLLAFTSYLKTLLHHCKTNPERVLRGITNCPVGFLQLLNHKNLPFRHVRAVIKLVDMLSEENHGPLHASRLKQFYRIFAGTYLLRRSLREHAAEMFKTPEEEKRLKNFLTSVIGNSCEIVTDILPLLKDMVKPQGGEELDCHCQFLLHLLIAQTGNAISASNLEWNTMQLVPTNPEISNCPIDEASVTNYLGGLPNVRKKGSYGSVEAYMDTYFRLFKEDCFWGLKQGISNLRNNRLDPRDMKVWPNGHVIGFNFGVEHSGITVGITAERVEGSRLPLDGNLLCLSDDGGHFDSPIWGVVTHCEDWDEGTAVMFVEVLDTRHGAAEVEVEAIGRLLAASRIVMAESPVFYRAYQPVLKALQEKDLNNFPFREELVYAKWPATPPPYLTDPSTSVNWRCLFNEDGEGSINEGKSKNFSQISMPEDTRTVLSTGLRILGRTVTRLGYHKEDAIRAPVQELDNLLESGHKTSLDDSQIQAIKLALANRLVLIQGPPGTGKTYVGVKLLQLLLSANTLPPGPILVMTYKNHGLDNFLMGCLKFSKKLVRIGRRSTEPELLPYNLNLKVSRADEFTSDYSDFRRRLDTVQVKMEKAFQELRGSSVFNSDSMVNQMLDGQLRLFLSNSEHGKVLLKSFPDEISVAECIAGGMGETGDARKLVTSLYNLISKLIRQWIPQKTTFELVENCFSLCRPSPALNDIRFRNICDRLSDRDIDEWSELEEFLEIDDEESSKSRKGRSWLKEDNFFHFTMEDSGNLFSKRVNLHIDINKYRWLLNENPWSLNEQHRVLLVHVILQTQYEVGLKKIADLKKEYDEVCGDINHIRELRQLRVLEKSQIVGMTTAGAAMYRNVIQMLRPSIVFVEEASEILEPQVSAVIGPSVQHLILIGDHCQLSPHVACYELELSHDFAVSMFERLVEHNKMSFQCLAVQSRMREEFLPMILPIYPHVRSNTKLLSGERNKEPTCMMSPMYFWCHSYPETRHRRSHSNEREAEMVLALLRWMIAEGENPEHITVLAAYNGQVILLREKLQKCPSAKDVEVQSIDRFQGSENKIVIVSLVRSNDDGDIGYLSKRNRLCVAVSRARGALYFCGNDVTFSKSPHWRRLVDYFKDKQCLGEQIYLRCPRHTSNPPLDVCNKDVDSFSHLLCDKPCAAILECNHYCQSTCHYGDHPSCSIEIQFRFKSCGHQASKVCSLSEEHLICLKEISYTFDECGHTEVFKCWRVTKKEGLHCMHSCLRVLECGHPCTRKCHENCKANPCEFCTRIEKEKAIKEKERERKELQMKKEELEKEIARLKSQDDTGQVARIELDSEGDTAAEYWQVRDRTEKFIQPIHGILPIVIKIEKLSNLQSQIKFLETQKDLIRPTAPAQLLFHGTSDEAIEGILDQGFKLPSKDKNNMFGQGIYFATDSSKSAQQIYTKGSNKLLLCEVLLGATWTVQNSYPEMNKETINKKGYDSLFSKREGKEKGGTLYDEFVIYDPCQAIPRYIVHYKNLGFDPKVMASRVSSNNQNLTRVQYELSQTYGGDDNPAEYHFRMAESQFFRMSSRNDYKVIKVEHILNKMLQERYENAKEEFEKHKKSLQEMLVFHGTKKDAIEKIIEEGFKIGGQGVAVLNGSVYGEGVYTAVDPNISIPYSKGGGMILLSSALVGKKDVDYNEGSSSSVLVLKKSEYLLPKYIVHYTDK